MSKDERKKFVIKSIGDAIVKNLSEKQIIKIAKKQKLDISELTKNFSNDYDKSIKVKETETSELDDILEKIESNKTIKKEVDEKSVENKEQDEKTKKPIEKVIIDDTNKEVNNGELVDIDDERMGIGLF